MEVMTCKYIPFSEVFAILYVPLQRVVLQYGPGALPWTSIQLSHDNTESVFNYCSKSKTSACGGCHSSKLSACFVNCDLCTFQLAPHFLQGYHTTKPRVRKWLDCSMHVFVHGLFSTWKGQKNSSCLPNQSPANWGMYVPRSQCYGFVMGILHLLKVNITYRAHGYVSKIHVYMYIQK